MAKFKFDAEHLSKDDYVRTIEVEFWGVESEDIIMHDVHSKEQVALTDLSAADYATFLSAWDSALAEAADELSNDLESAYWDRKIDESRGK